MNEAERIKDLTSRITRVGIIEEKDMQVFLGEGRFKPCYSPSYPYPIQELYDGEIGQLKNLRIIVRPAKIRGELNK